MIGIGPFGKNTPLVPKGLMIHYMSSHSPVLPQASSTVTGYVCWWVGSGMQVQRDLRVIKVKSVRQVYLQSADTVCYWTCYVLSLALSLKIDSFPIPIREHRLKLFIEYIPTAYLLLDATYCLHLKPRQHLSTRHVCLRARLQQNSKAFTEL